ncbi:MAG: zf-TFIIB domain-containing protein [Myxococcota bacterium]|nr:zf-TFIIB domain-containing protein [Myxococcota bacterium]
MFRDDRPICLACDSGLEKRGQRWACGACSSKLMPAIELQDALNEVSPDDYRELDERLVPSKLTAPNVCPLCKSTMSTWSILDVPVDRCSEHGVWIDRGREAEMILANEQMFTSRNPREPRGAWFPLGIGVIFGALLSPWLDRRRLRLDIERTSPPKAKK